MKKFFKQLAENWIAAVIGLIVMTSITQCNRVVDYFDEGAQLKEQADYDAKLDTALAIRFNDPVFMDRVMKSPYMMDWRANERIKIVEDVKHQDSTKLKMSAYLSDQSGMSKRAMMDTVVVMINERKAGKKFVTNSECIRNSKEYGRGRNQLIRH